MEIKPKTPQPEAQDATTGVTTDKVTAAPPAPQSNEQESQIVPLEVVTRVPPNGGRPAVSLKIEGDFVTLELNAYTTEHIGQFRNCDFVRLRFKAGTIPDIIALKSGD